MIIDDDATDRFILRKVLENITKAEVVEFDSGLKALENLTNISKDKPTFRQLIFLDVNMPVLDGFGFLDALNQLSGEYKTRCHIIFISSHVNDPERKKISSYANVIGYFEKPVKEESLLELKKIIQV